MTDTGPRLSVTTRLHEGALTVDARVDNLGAVDVYVHHLMTVHPERSTGAYAFHGPGDELLLLCGAPPPPPLVSPGWPGRLAASLVEPSASLRWSLSLPLPLLEHGLVQPPDPEAAAQPHVVDCVRLLVDTQPMSPQLQVRELTGHDAFDVWGPTPPRLEASAFLPGPCTIRRREQFHRAW
ncbi:MAG: hypothetical protein K0V04_21350 [Deltaproteobacteria bacterium]|nr:hypothetical protein [Deltaproteobacteria bacterium]